MIFYFQQKVLIKLPKIEPNPFAKPIQLPMKCSDDFENVDVAAVGNGRTTMSSSIAQDFKLREAFPKTIPIDRCEKRLRTKWKLDVKPDGILCAEPTAILKL